MSEQINFISSGTTRFTKNLAPGLCHIGFSLGIMGVIYGWIMRPVTGILPGGNAVLSTFSYGFGVLCFTVWITSAIWEKYVNARQRAAYRKMSGLVEKSRIASWKGDASAFSEIRSSFPSIGAFPDYECISVDTEQYYDIPETKDAAAFKKELLDAFYKRVFQSQIDDIRVINLGSTDALQFTMPHGYRMEGTTVTRGIDSEGLPTEGSYGWYGYIFYWVDLRNSGNKISWSLKKAMLDELGWNAGDPSRGKLIGVRDFLLQCLAEAYKGLTEQNRVATLGEGVREAKGVRTVLHDADEPEAPVVTVPKHRVVVDEEDPQERVHPGATQAEIPEAKRGHALNQDDGEETIFPARVASATIGIPLEKVTVHEHKNTLDITSTKPVVVSEPARVKVPPVSKPAHLTLQPYHIIFAAVGIVGSFLMGNILGRREATKGNEFAGSVVRAFLEPAFSLKQQMSAETTPVVSEERSTFKSSLLPISFSYPSGWEVKETSVENESSVKVIHSRNRPVIWSIRAVACNDVLRQREVIEIMELLHTIRKSQSSGSYEGRVSKTSSSFGKKSLYQSADMAEWSYTEKMPQTGEIIHVEMDGLRHGNTIYVVTTVVPEGRGYLQDCSKIMTTTLEWSEDKKTQK